MDFIKQNWKWLLGLIVTIIASLIPLFIQHFSAPNKQLVFQIDSISQLAGKSQSVKIEDLKIIYKNKEIEKAYLAIYSIFNSGNIPILKSDFDSSIDLLVGKNTSILSAEIIKTDPRSIKPKLDVNTTKISVLPLLLNPGDYIQLKLFISGDSIEIKPVTRIVGIPDITTADGREYRIPMVYHVEDWPIGFLLSTVGLYLGLSGIVALRNNRHSHKTVFRPIEFMVIGIFLCWPAGLALMDDGARYYNIYPSFLIRLLIFVPLYMALLYLLWKTRPKQMAAK